MLVGRLKSARAEPCWVKEMSVFVVPEPKSLEPTGRWLTFNGFRDFPEFLSNEFHMPDGDWGIARSEQEGTGLQVRDREVTIWGDESVAYATVLQLVRKRRGYLPELILSESLQYTFRGYHLDIARGAVPNVETFKRILRWLFLLKYNCLAIYFEDLFPWSRHPTIGKLRGGMTQEELKQVVEYGKHLGVTVFPSLELAGHMEHTLSLPEYREFSEWHRPMEGCLDVSNEKAREFAYELLREAAEFFPSKYVHIGGDETWALGRGESLNRTWRFEGPTLYENHHRRMVEIVEEYGKEPILWGDMISGMYLRGDEAKWAEAIQSEIWRRALIANWGYSPSSKQQFKDKIRLFKDRGLEQIACPGLSNWNRYYPNYQTALENLTNFLTAARDERLPGFLITTWGDDGGECLFSLLEPLLLASMEIAEGNGRWEEKWTALTGETEPIREARILFGNPDISDVVKHVIFGDLWYQRLSPERKQELKALWKKTLEQVEETNLPEDLDFVRRLLQVSLRVLNAEAKVSDYLMLSGLYARLWLSERKPEGLGTVIERFWGAAGRQDLKLQRTQ